VQKALAEKAPLVPPPAAGKAAAVTPPAASGQPALAGKANVQPGDWNQFGGSSRRNNVSDAVNLPDEWKIEYDVSTGIFLPEKSQNIKWATPLGSQTFGNAVVANGKIFIGTNNGNGYLKRYPAAVDLGCLLCLDEKTGKFLWQDSSEKLPTGRVHDWPLLGICSAVLAEGDRVWYVTSRGEVKCLDANGFLDYENDGPLKNEKFTAKDEADIVWSFDMMKQLGISQHNMCSCSVTGAGEFLIVNTGNGVDEGHTNVPAPHAPSFLVLNKTTGKVVWTDNTPGENILHGQYSSPAFAELGGVPQAIFSGGDGYLYSFDVRGDNGKPKLLWKFDCNPKESKYKLTGATRNHLIAMPLIHEGLVFVGVGEDPEHGQGPGRLWCINPVKKLDGSDVSPELVFNTKSPDKPIAPKRNQAAVKEDGDFVRPNPNSAAVWQYSSFDANKNGEIDFEEEMHRTMGNVAIKDNLLVVIDMSGLVHCLDPKTGMPHWKHDMLAASWGSPLLADGKIYCGDEDGDVSIFKLSPTKDLIGEISMGSAVYSSPIVANNVLYISNKNYLFAIETKAK